MFFDVECHLSERNPVTLKLRWILYARMTIYRKINAWTLETQFTVKSYAVADANSQFDYLIVQQAKSIQMYALKLTLSL